MSKVYAEHFKYTENGKAVKFEDLVDQYLALEGRGGGLVSAEDFAGFDSWMDDREQAGIVEVFRR